MFENRKSIKKQQEKASKTSPPGQKTKAEKRTAIKCRFEIDVSLQFAIWTITGFASARNDRRKHIKAIRKTKKKGLKMANKRMFTMKICDSDAFLEMPLTAQCLYFHLNMRADDDGFVANPKRIARLIGAAEDDLKVLIAKKFVLCFENGVIVIKHWRMHNTLSKGRYHETVYTEEKNILRLKENGAYSLTSGKRINDKRLAEMFRQSDKDEK